MRMFNIEWVWQDERRAFDELKIMCDTVKLKLQQHITILEENGTKHQLVSFKVMSTCCYDTYFGIFLEEDSIIYMTEDVYAALMRFTDFPETFKGEN